MRLDRYLLGIRLQLRSPLPPAEVAERINHAADSSFNPFAFGPTGGVAFGRIRLHYRLGVISFRVRSTLSGSLRAAPQGSVLHLRFGASRWIIGQYVVWYLLVGYIGVMGFEPVLLVFMLAPLWVMAAGAWHSDEVLDDLLTFLSNEAEVSPDTGSAILA